jgi:hypothetical protein
MGDGHLNKCKSCAKKDVSDHRVLNIEKVRAYDRARAKHPARAQASAAVTKAWRAEDKRRQLCHSRVSQAIKTGRLVRKPCQHCGEQKSVAHHDDYDKPFDVTWLCQPCHKEAHKRKGQTNE